MILSAGGETRDAMEKTGGSLWVKPTLFQTVMCLYCRNMFDGILSRRLRTVYLLHSEPEGRRNDLIVSDSLFPTQSERCNNFITLMYSMYCVGGGGGSRQKAKKNRIIMR